MTPLLELRDVHSYYGQSHVLQGISLQVNPGEIVLLSGRNGAGKSTTIKSIMGFVPPGPEGLSSWGKTYLKAPRM